MKNRFFKYYLLITLMSISSLSKSDSFDVSGDKNNLIKENFGAITIKNTYIGSSGYIVNPSYTRVYGSIGDSRDDYKDENRINIKIESKLSGEVYSLSFAKNATLEWVLKEAKNKNKLASTLNVSSHHDININWVLVDTKLREYWKSVSDKKNIKVIVRSGFLNKKYYSKYEYIKNIPIEKDTVFYLYGDVDKNYIEAGNGKYKSNDIKNPSIYPHKKNTITMPTSGITMPTSSIETNTYENRKKQIEPNTDKEIKQQRVNTYP